VIVALPYKYLVRVSSVLLLQRGIPVATVAINNGMNAGLLAIRVLSAGMPRLINAMDAYMKKMEGEVLSKVDTLRGDRMGNVSTDHAE
jgi:phosphoribosylcarboxyaminoimidazole (NCAIR) mutase